MTIYSWTIQKSSRWWKTKTFRVWKKYYKMWKTLWFHTKCNQLNFIAFQHIKACTEPWFCFECISSHFPFGTLNNQTFSSFVLNNKNSNANIGNSINLEPPPNLSLLFNQFNDLSSDSINKNPENLMTNCKYYDIDDIQKIKSKPNYLSLYSI